MTRELAKQLKAEAAAMEASERARTKAEESGTRAALSHEVLEACVKNLVSKVGISEASARRAMGLGASAEKVALVELKKERELTFVERKKEREESEAIEENLRESFMRMGLSETGAKAAARERR